MKKLPEKFANADINTVSIDEGKERKALGDGKPGKKAGKRHTVNRSALSRGLKELLNHFNEDERTTERPCFIGIDKLRMRLEASVKDAMPGEESRHLSNGVVLRPYNETGTVHHRCLWEIFADGDLVGTLETGGRMENMKKYDYLTLKNEVIWQKGWSSDILPNIVTALNTQVHSLSNLDICIDGLNDIVQVFDLYHWTNSATYNRYRKSESKLILPRSSGRRKTHFGQNKFDPKMGFFEHYYIGAKGADKRFVIYEKNQEIRDISPHKAYIRDTWNLNGMNVTEDDTVMRCEMRLKGEALDAFDIKDLSLLEDEEYLRKVFRTATDNFVDFRVSDGKARTDEAIKLDVFGFIKLGVQKLPLIKKYLSVGLYKAKMAIHSAFQHCISQDFPPDEESQALQHIYNLVNRFNLREYTSRRIYKWIEKYKKPIIDRDTGEFFGYPDYSRLLAVV